MSLTSDQLKNISEHERDLYMAAYCLAWQDFSRSLIDFIALENFSSRSQSIHAKKIDSLFLKKDNNL